MIQNIQSFELEGFTAEEASYTLLRSLHWLGNVIKNVQLCASALNVIVSTVVKLITIYWFWALMKEDDLSHMKIIYVLIILEHVLQITEEALVLYLFCGA